MLNKPLLQLHQMMSQISLDEKMPFAWMVIMDFQWFDQVSWNSIKDIRGTTYVQPPTRFKFALQQAQHAILRAITHNSPSSPASGSAWKALILSSWLLLGRPAVHASESSCAQFLDARFRAFLG